MNLDASLSLIATRFGLDARELIACAALDTIGGFHADPTQSTWPMGSMYEVEGKTLYALVRVTHPTLVMQLGGWQGCSTAHIASALIANGKGRLISVDLYPEPACAIEGAPVSYWTGDALDFLKDVKAGSVGLLFEDLYHGADQTRDIWTLAQAKVKKGGYIVSHDAAHPGVGADVRAGIEAAGVTDALTVLAEPSDCGLALFRVE